MSDAAPILTAVNLKKSFGHVTALDGMSMAVYQGEIVAVVGDNGCGKSTLLKILCGVMRADEGTIIVNGTSYSGYGVREAQALGITAMYQDLALDPMRDVAGNIFLGSELTIKGVWIDRKRMRLKTAELLNALSINIPDPTVLVKHLSGGQRQSIAIARAIYRKTKIMMFDEPTAAMGVAETRKILQLILGLREEGITTILISHNLFQVFEVADRIVIMGVGNAMADVKTRDSSPDEINHLITNRGAR